MPKALDLRVLVEKTWEVTLINGKKLDVKKPTKRIQTLMESMKNDMTLEEQVKLTNDATVAILNNNQEGYPVKKLTKEYTIEIQLAVIRGYSEWLHELMSDPN